MQALRPDGDRGEALEGGASPPDIYCPTCEYPLRSVEEAGMRQCPECGTDVDFDRLRRLRLVGQDLGTARQIFWKVLWLPGRFFGNMMAPRYYARVGDLKDYYVRAVPLGALVGFALAGFGGLLGLGRPDSLVSGFVSCLMGLLCFFWAVTPPLAQMAAGMWTSRLLKWAGHGEPRQGADRIMIFAEVPYVLMAVDLWVILAGVALLAGTGREVAEVVVLGGAAGYVLLWLYWGWIIMRAFQAETRSLDTMLAPLALFNPGLVLALVLFLPPVLCGVGGMVA